MKPEESTAEKYLNDLNRGRVTYEPQGNVPPDFSLGADIAVEVRRLNENYFANGKSRGLEEVSVPLFRVLDRLLLAYDQTYDGRSYGVGIMFRRPLLTSTPRDLKKALDQFLGDNARKPRDVRINRNTWLQIFPIRQRANQVFRRAIDSDNDSGGVVVSLYVKNIVRCLTEKSLKIAANKRLYDQWWLLLVDAIWAWNLMPEEIDQVRAGITSLQAFDKLIVINHSGSMCLLEI